MKIQSSSIKMSSDHTLTQVYEKHEHLEAWSNNPSSLTSKLKTLTDALNSKDKLSLSAEAQDFSRKRLKALADATNTAQTAASQNTEANSGIKFKLSEEDKRKIIIIEDFLRSILHRKVVLQVPDDILTKNDALELVQPTNVQVVPTQSSVGWGFRYNLDEAYSEKEVMTFKSAGIINTEDGKSISINISLNMTRSFYEENHLSIKAGDAAIDPLVINFDGKAAELTNTTYSFDLDSDGTSEQISTLKDGSGLLALDLNNDGVINNGSELLGPQSGNGFQELSKYDTDHNNWIDENDAVFDKLRIWTKDETGKDKLFALGEKGIGAIYLENISSEFSIKDTSNNTQGELKYTGIFLKESGETGTIQHINFVV